MISGEGSIIARNRDMVAREGDIVARNRDIVGSHDASR
jgi:hypothetical protein